MNISKNSWHYRVCDWYSWVPSNSLCLYFWQVVWACVLSFILIPFAIVFVGFMLLGVFPFIIGSTLTGNFHQDIHLMSWYTILVSWSVGAGIFAVIGVAGLLKLLYDDKIIFKNRKEKDVEKEPNLVVEWVRAKKAKVCPVITFKND